MGFSPQNEHTPPPKGGGARYRLSWVCWGCSAPPQLGHAGPTGLVWCCAGVVPCPTLKTAHRLSQGRVWFFSPKRVYPSPERGRGRVSSNLARWDFNAEKPGAFPQEKRDTSYPWASLGSCLWQLLLTNGLTRPQQGRSGAAPVSFPYPVLKTAHRAAQGRVWISPPFPGTL